jgi:hypothetical protein
VLGDGVLIAADEAGPVVVVSSLAIPRRSPTDVAHRLDVEAVQVTYVSRIIVRVVMPQSWAVEDLGAEIDCSLVKGVDRRSVGCGESDVWWLTGRFMAIRELEWSEEQRRSWRDAKSDTPADVEHPSVAEWCENSLIEIRSRSHVAALQ